MADLRDKPIHTPGTNLTGQVGLSPADFRSLPAPVPSAPQSPANQLARLLQS